MVNDEYAFFIARICFFVSFQVIKSKTNALENFQQVINFFWDGKWSLTEIDAKIQSFFKGKEFN